MSFKEKYINEIKNKAIQTKYDYNYCSRSKREKVYTVDETTRKFDVYAQNFILNESQGQQLFCLQSSFQQFLTSLSLP